MKLYTAIEHSRNVPSVVRVHPLTTTEIHRFVTTGGWMPVPNSDPSNEHAESTTRVSIYSSY
jgi:hypothetical protein